MKLPVFAAASEGRDFAEVFSYCAWYFTTPLKIQLLAEKQMFAYTACWQVFQVAAITGFCAISRTSEG
jgi:hypothetical protein